MRETPSLKRVHGGLNKLRAPETITMNGGDVRVRLVDVFLFRDLLPFSEAPVRVAEIAVKTVIVTALCVWPGGPRVTDLVARPELGVFVALRILTMAWVASPAAFGRKVIPISPAQAMIEAAVQSVNALGMVSVLLIMFVHMGTFIFGLKLAGVASPSFTNPDYRVQLAHVLPSFAQGMFLGIAITLFCYLRPRDAATWPRTAILHSISAVVGVACLLLIKGRHCDGHFVRGAHVQATAVPILEIMAELAGIAAGYIVILPLLLWDYPYDGNAAAAAVPDDDDDDDEKESKRERER